MYDQRTQDIIDEFEFLDDWEERYRHVIELGKTQEPLKESERTDSNKVKGCVSQVWLICEITGGPVPTLVLRTDSDAHIVRGLAVLLVRLYSGRPLHEIPDIDANKVIETIGLANNLSAQRSNGLSAMVAKIQSIAKNHMP